MVVGSGIAGMYFSLKAAEFAEVWLISKDEFQHSNSILAQGGIAAVLHSDDEIENHINDTLIAGDGLCRVDAVEKLANEASGCIKDLLSLGVPFDIAESGDLHLGREGGHSQNRIVHAGDHTGLSVAKTLMHHIRKNPNIHLFEKCFVLDLIHKDNVCEGLFVLENNEIKCIYGHAVILACGGAGNIYQVSTNPPTATADGFAIAYRAGIKLENMEFVQFHPTLLYKPDDAPFLISEALRGFGAELVLPNGETFMHKYHPLGSLAPRDVVSRSIVKELQAKQLPWVGLDLKAFEPDAIQSHFPTIYAHCLKVGIDLKKDVIPVVPAAHYMCGGIQTGLNAESSMKGLYALGENSCTGVHGANRLASNSLLECLVFANAAAIDISSKDYKSDLKANSSQKLPEMLHQNINETQLIRESLIDLQKLMWEHVGIIRHDVTLKNTLNQIQNALNLLPDFLNSREFHELKNQLQCAYLICNSAIDRNENKGAHFKC